jgi:hypothetical protein
MGYFFGFKLYIVINGKGELLNFVITPGNTDDYEPLKSESFLKALKGKLYADKGYISQELTRVLFLDGLHLITSIRNNMKNTLMELKDKILLRKRSVIDDDDSNDLGKGKTYGHKKSKKTKLKLMIKK